jgi:GTP-binding protein of the ras superfamily involved in termination of M-phase
MEKTISIRNTEITFSIWDLGGQREFVNMLPLVCNDAVAILFMFDLSRKSTLNSIKEWYRQARGFNKVCAYLDHSLTPIHIYLRFIVSFSQKTAIPFLIGTKYDHFAAFSKDEQEEITRQVSISSSFFFFSLSWFNSLCKSHRNHKRMLIIVFPTDRSIICSVPEVRKSNESALDILFHFPLNQCTKDIQNRFI